MLDRPDDFDAVVIGGGPAGAMMAPLLARAGWSVAVIESKPFPRRKVCGEYLSATNWPLLETLGLAAAFDHRAGPEVRRVGLLAGRSFVVAELPQPKPDPAVRWGRALSREKLDTLLLERAVAHGAEVLQPWRAVELRTEADSFAVLAECQASGETRRLRSSIIVAAHGSWTSGPLPTQAFHHAKRPDDLFGFKASFLNAAARRLDAARELCRGLRRLGAPRRRADKSLALHSPRSAGAARPQFGRDGGRGRAGLSAGGMPRAAVGARPSRLQSSLAFGRPDSARNSPRLSTRHLSGGQRRRRGPPGRRRGNHDGHAVGLAAGRALDRGERRGLFARRRTLSGGTTPRHGGAPSGRGFAPRPASRTGRCVRPPCRRACRSFAASREC